MKHYRTYPSGIGGRQVDTALRHKPSAECQALGAVVVSADNKYGNIKPCKTGDKIIEKHHRLGRRQGLVIYIARYYNSVRALLLGNFGNSAEYMLLLLY